MDNSSQSILETLRTVEFRLGLKGYNVDEVDEYLEKAAVEAESVLEQLRTANERLRHATDRVGQLEAELQRSPAERAAAPSSATAAPDDALQRTLLLAQKFVDQTKRESEAEAHEVVSRAEERARTVVTQAEERARQIVTESEERVREEVSRLEATRTRLAGEVENLTKHLDEQRARIRGALSDALKWFDDHVPAPPPRPAANDAARPQPDRRPAGVPEHGQAATSGNQPSQPGPSSVSPSALGNPAGPGTGSSGGGAPNPRGDVTTGGEVTTGSEVTAGSAAGRRPSAGDLFGNGRSSD